MKNLRNLVLAALTYACGAMSSAYGANIIPGIYAIKICRGVCTSVVDTTIVTGQVVLLPAPITDSKGRFIRVDYEVGKANGCFWLWSIARHSLSFAGARENGYLAWERQASSENIVFSLVHSPDSGYQVTVIPTASGLSGKGRSWASLPPDDMPPDAVELVRQGDAPPDGCSAVDSSQSG